MLLCKLQSVRARTQARIRLPNHNSDPSHRAHRHTQDMYIAWTDRGFKIGGQGTLLEVKVRVAHGRVGTPEVGSKPLTCPSW